MAIKKQYEEKRDDDKHDHDKDCRPDHDDGKDRDKCKYREHYKYREYWKVRDCDDDKYEDKYDKYDKYDKKDEKSHHIHELDKTIKSLADRLADLGRGAHLLELQRIIHGPGWTSAAELAFVNAILDHLSVEVRTIERLQADLVEASRKVKKDRH